MKPYLVFVAVAFAALPTLAQAQLIGSAEDVQIRSVDFNSQVLELFNFGSSSLDLDGWRFCTHDEVDGFDYTSSSGLNGVSLAAGSSLSIHWNDDASGPNAINVSSLGGAWIDDLSVDDTGDGISLGLYRSGPFGNSDNLIDHVQYSFDGANIGGSANPRGTVAVNAGLWGNTADWISVDESSNNLVLVDDPFPGANSETHTSSSYSVNVAVPEPSAMLVLSLGFAAISIRRRRVSQI